MKLVSIIVPVYNISKKIVTCYNSLINQTYKNIEIIFVYEGIVDDTINLLNSFLDSRVVVINYHNNSLLEARRKGFLESHGEYVCFIDSDDWIEKDYISKLVHYIEKDNSNIAIGRFGFHYNYSLVKNITLKVRRKPKFIDLEKKKEYLPVFNSGIVGKLFKRDMLKEVNFRVSEDIAIMYPMYIKCRYISVVNNTVYHYNLLEIKKGSFGYRFDNLLNIFESLKCVYDELNKVDKLEDYFYEIEMLFIKNIFEMIWNIIQCVPDKIYRYKFICVLLDYLEVFFPDWEKNPYYVRGFKLLERFDLFYVRKVFNVIVEIKRKKLYISLDEVYDRYKKIEKMYDKSK